MLAPIFLTDEEIEELETSEDTAQEPSKTYKFDFEKGDLVNEYIDNEEAIKQAALKSILTYRDKYLIYSEDYGCEIFYLIGEAYSEEYLKIEVPRLISEALMPDERIESADNFEISKQGDRLTVSFEISTTITDTNIELEVVF